LYTGKTSVDDKIVIENIKKRKGGNERMFYKNFHLGDGLEINSQPANAN